VKPEDDLDVALRSLFADGDARPARRAGERIDGLDGLMELLTGAGGVHRLEGEVSFVADGDPELVGVRAAGLLEGRQVVIEAGPITVVLDVTPAGDEPASDQPIVAVRGEVVGTDEPLSLQLLHDGLELALAVTDEMGEFAFSDVPVGLHELIVAGARFEVVVDVELR
jgi:hypothetical protein